MSPPPSISYRLRPASPPVAPISLTSEQRRVTLSTTARLRVLAGPGTGKTTTLVEAVAERVLVQGVPAEQILVLTFSRRAAAELSDRISRRLELTTRASMVRTLHSYAYSVVRTQAARADEPAPRLLAAGESDHMVRELLAGHQVEGGGWWPDYLGGALCSPTFAAELREVLLRAAGQGVSPAQMVALGRRHKRPEWVAAGRFAREYQQVSDLRQGISGFGVALDQAELTAAALGALRRDEVLAAEQRRIRRIFVDEYQDVDPAQARLISVLATGATELVVFGDPDQSIYAFRGAESTALRDVVVDRTVALTISRRLPAALLSATRRVARQLPGPASHRDLHAGGDPADDDVPDHGVPDHRVPDHGVPDHGVPDYGVADQGLDDGRAPDRPVAGGRVTAGEVDIRVLPTAAREASYLADRLRRAHLLDGVPWSSMAILLRSPAAGVAALTRACAVAGVPVVLGAGDEILSAEPVVVALLSVLECGMHPAALTGERALELLASPLAGLDALGLRRIRRALRTAHPGAGSSADLLAGVLAGAPLPDAVRDDPRVILGRVQELLRIARAGAGSPAAEQVLWQVWQASGLEQTLVAAVERAGTSGQRADRALDAVLGLFAMAAQLAERLPQAGVAAFLAEVRGQHLPTDPELDRSADAVAVLSAHASKGLEWQVVAVAGVQEGTWPDLRARGSLLGGQELLNLATELPAGVPPAGLLADERRLFYVAATRARQLLICTAVSNQNLAPSRFLTELAGVDIDLPVEQDALSSGRAREHRGLHLADLVADLRRAVTDPLAPAADAAAAAGHLAELAAAGVGGAHPDDWYGLAGTSTDQPAIPPGAAVRVSPSLVEALNTCALRAVLERRGGRTEPGQAQLEGIVVHAMANGLALGIPDVDLRSEIESFLAGQDKMPPWQRNRTRRGLLAMLAAAQEWVRDNHPPRTLIGSELDMDLAIPSIGESGESDAAFETNPVRLVGRVDWLSANPDGSVVITDFKTGASVPTKAEVQANPQLASYQAAMALGAFAATSTAAPRRSGGAELVYLRSGRPKVLQQNALTGESTARWLGSIRSAAAHLAGATAWAQENSHCERCPVRTSCPLQNEGRQVTR